jgi:uncharacterized OB-fold protein
MAYDDVGRLLAGRCPGCGMISYPPGHEKRNWREFLRSIGLAMRGDLRAGEWAEVTAKAARVERVPQ